MIVPVQEPHLKAILHMTYPNFRPLLQSMDEGVIGLAKWESGTPVGLILGRAEVEHGEVLSLFVEREQRGRNFGQFLLSAAETAFHARGVRTLACTFNASTASAPAVARILEKSGWSKPEPHMMLAQIGREIMELRWFHRIRLRAPFEVIPWVEVSAAEREALQKLQDETQFVPELLWPFLYEENLDPTCSVGLRRDGMIVGWIVTNRTGPKTLRYTSVFVREEFRYPGRVFLLLAEAVRRQAASLGLDSVGTLGVPAGDYYSGWASVVREKLGPCLRSVTQTCRAVKHLS